jgi:predicted RNase H-like HicB family nuclease
MSETPAHTTTTADAAMGTLQLTIKRDSEGSYLVSDEHDFVSSAGATLEEALADYAYALRDFYIELDLDSIATGLSAPFRAIHKDLHAFLGEVEEPTP